MNPTITSGSRNSASRQILPLLALITLFGAGACSTVTIKTKPRDVTREGIRSARVLGEIVTAPATVLGAFAKGAADLLRDAERLEREGRMVDAAGSYVRAAVDARELIASGTEPAGSESEMALIKIHNAALARFVELWSTDPRRLESGPYLLSGNGEPLEISLSGDSAFPRHYFDRIISSDSIQEKGIASHGRPGIGAPIVGIREQRPERAHEMKFYPLKGLHVPVTVTIDSVRRPPSGGLTSVVFSMRDPLSEQKVTVGRRSFPLAANFSAPIAVILDRQSEGLLGLQGFFKADQRTRAAGIYLTEPYDPKRIPVLLIHGLISVPMIWRDIVPEMMADPKIAQRYQFMVFAYPSGIPILESAAMLRKSLAEIRAHYDPDGGDPLSRNMVVAGHSMGGILTHTLVADIGDNLWNQINKTQLEELDISREEREELRKVFYFDPDPAVRRAIFFSAPHRGAKLAEKGIAGMLSKLAKLPLNTLRVTTDLLDPRVAPNLGLIIGKDKKYTSAQSLKPGAPMVAALDVSPYKKGVIYHSIIGDRGRGDTPNSSDGVVEYWSSHQKGAASELIVPTGHGSYKHPLAIEDMKRILREHAGIR